MSNKNDLPPAYPAHQDASPYIQSPPPAASGGDNRLNPYSQNNQREEFGSPSPNSQQQPPNGFYGPVENQNYPGNGPYNNQNQYYQGGYGYGPPPGGMYYQYQQRPQGGYYYGDSRGGAGTDVCAGLLGALACCCCLDALLWI